MPTDTPHGPAFRVDLHSHTRFSPDATTRPEELVERAVGRGLDRIAVTDHGEVEGALRAREAGGERVIVGEEIGCRCGTELIGLFLRERIETGLPLEEVAERIRAQGGVVYAPHPFAYPTRARWRAERALAVADVAEAFNSRAFLPAWNRRALAEARRRGLATAAGSDAHFPREIGRAYTELPAFASAAEFRAALRHAVPVAVRTASPLVHVASISLARARRIAAALLGRDPLLPGRVGRVPAPGSGASR